MRDKITLSYILLTIVIVGAITFFVAKLDIAQMNSDISRGSSKAISTGEEYSKKLYNLAVAKMSNEDNVTKTKEVKIVEISTKAEKEKRIDGNLSTHILSKQDTTLIQAAQTNLPNSKLTFSGKKGKNK